MKIGTSDYSFRHDLASGDLDYIEGLPTIIKDLGLSGIECLDGPLEQNLPDIELDDIKNFQQHLRTNYNLEILGITGFRLPGWGFGRVWEPFSLEKIMPQLDFQREIVLDWVDICGSLNIPNIRFDAGKFQASHKVPIHAAIDLNIEIYRRVLTPICAKAHELGVKVGVENHGFFTADIKVLTKLLDEIPHLHVTCDTGNWPFESRLGDIEQIAGRVNFLHAKAHVFNDDGTETNIDYEGIVDIMRDAGFDGWWSIEWEGEGMS
ncbi:TIM barrel protein, partial [Candidatus Bathyarchaeota archaeon]|nr:TIM barrel protein [Candidatus Bathyarchaeota archaeon]